MKYILCHVKAEELNILHYSLVGAYFCYHLRDTNFLRNKSEENIPNLGCSTVGRGVAHPDEGPALQFLL